MVLFNYSTRELTAKVVYYGPGLCGKTTNLQYIHSTLPDNVKGKMLSLATKTDRTLFFDFLPIDLGQIRGMKTRVQLYTVPGQVFYNETRKLVLKGADGIVFVADSQSTMLGANVESFKNLEENLKAHGMNLAEMPHVLQFNKRDLPKLASIEELNSAINKFNAPFYESVATTGIGVQDTLKAVTKLVLLHLTKKYDPKSAASAQPTMAAPNPAPVGAGRPQPAPSRAAAARPEPPSPAQTMQMPVAPARPGADPLGGIPLSATPADAITPAEPAPTSPVTSAPDGLGGTPPLTESSFADDEIQELVDEVQESPMGGEMPLEQFPPQAVDLGLAESDGQPPSLESAISLDDGPEPLQIEPTDRPPAAAPSPPARPSAAAPQDVSSASPAFEIDHGVDPEWDRARSPEETPIPEIGQPSESPPIAPPIAPATGTDTDDAWDLGPVDDVPAESGEEPEPFSEPLASRELGRSADDELPTLTDVAGDQQMFVEESGLDIARLKAGEEREIVVPLEIDEPGKALQRFKLSIHLRLDPID